MTKFILIGLFSILISTNYAFAQKTDTGNWMMYFGSQKINNKWNWHNEIQYRNYNIAGDLQQLLLRTGIGYNLTENNNNLLLGYGFINSQNYIANTDEKIAINEHRLYQQFITRQSFGRVNIQHRYRIEERFIANSDFKMRYRYFLSLNVPLTKKTMAKNTLYASAYNEIFINGRSSVFDRNRVFGALGFVINKDLKIEAGYMSQISEKSKRGQFQIGFFNNLSFMEKNK